MQVSIFLKFVSYIIYNDVYKSHATILLRYEDQLQKSKESIRRGAERIIIREHRSTYRTT
ncbi:MAG: palindromic element RPE5 domain-containing protein [Rickettsia hoogstraalii]